MVTFDEVLEAAQALPLPDRLRLIEGIWDSVVPSDLPPPNEEWIAEAQRRSAEFDAGATSASSWPEVRNAHGEGRGWMADALILAEAERDYVEAFNWYARRSERAALRFEDEFERAIESIEQSPQRFPFCDDRHRFYLMRRYPFQVIYREAALGPLIVAVAHAKRRPGYWRDR